MFSKLMLSFLIIILIVSIFYLYSFRFFINIIENEISQKTNERFDNLVIKYDEYFKQIKIFLSGVYNDKALAPIIMGQKVTAFDQMNIINKLKEYKSKNDYLKYVKTVFIVTKNASDTIIELNSTYSKNDFYNVFFKNDIYNEAFWLKQMKKDFSYKIFPAGKYYNTSVNEPGNSFLMPVVLKKLKNSDFLIIALADIKQFNSANSAEYKDIFHICNSEGQLLYPLSSSIDTKHTNINKASTFRKTDLGYMFIRKSNTCSLKYFELIPNAKLQNQLNKVNSLFRFIVIISFMISIIISVLIVIRFNNPVKQIARIISSSNDSLEKETNAVSLNYISENINKIVNENASYQEDIINKNSLLESFLYQAKIKDIYIHISRAKNKFSIRNNYFLMCFKIHFRKYFHERMKVDTSKATFFLKELIQANINKYYNGSITFQNENDVVISIVNLNSENANIETFISYILKALKTEDEYVFFTIAVSVICNETSEINQKYKKLFEVIKYRNLMTETQVLYETIIDQQQNSFHFPLEQIDLLINTLHNAERTECMQMVKKILDYNYKRNVNNFHVHLLCLEIVNCCIRVLLKLYYCIPDEIEITKVYGQLEKCVTIDDYKNICEKLILQTVNYINNNSKESDHIIDYILKYIEDHYMEEIYLDLLAQNLSLTSSYISRYFKEKTGFNLNRYINNFRIKKATEILSNSSSNLMIKDVAAQVGILSISTFNRLFKQYTGFSPKQYKQSLGTEL